LRDRKGGLYPINKKKNEEDIVKEKLSVCPHDERNKAEQRDQGRKKEKLQWQPLKEVMRQNHRYGP